MEGMCIRASSESIIAINDIEEEFQKRRNETMDSIYKLDIGPEEKFILIIFSSKIDYFEDINDQYIYFKLSKLIRQSSIDKKEFLYILKKLIKLEYINKKEIVDDEDGLLVCITSKIFQ
jgi:hypothetical protein